MLDDQPVWYCDKCEYKCYLFFYFLYKQNKKKKLYNKLLTGHYSRNKFKSQSVCVCVLCARACWSKVLLNKAFHLNVIDIWICSCFFFHSFAPTRTSTTIYINRFGRFVEGNHFVIPPSKDDLQSMSIYSFIIMWTFSLNKKPMASK